MTTYTKAFFGQEGNPNFNLAAAVEAYEWVLTHPEEAPFVVSKMLFDNTSTLMEYYKEPISKAVDGYVSKRLEDAERGLSRSVSKSATDALGVVVALSKARGRDKWNRDPEGQFARYESRRAQAEDRARFDNPRGWGQPENGRPTLTPEMRNAGLDALTAMGSSPGFAEYLARTAGTVGREIDSERTGSFANKWGADIQNDRGVNDQTWRRLQASSKLAYDMGGKYLPEEAQFALKVGEWAGNYAPQAERVIGPTARRAAYRYRGVEKQPDPTYQRDIDALKISQKSGRAAHEALIYGTPSPTPRKGGGMWDDRTESRTITAMKKLLPDPSLYELSRKSGTIPPSQGIIIDRSGKVVTEAVGYGEDWYVPFNLKNLSRLRGGEYIRTRAYGGLTTEDIYVGMVSGARAVTVVSHSGTFTIEFDDTFRGSRRYNDKAGRMHARYAQLLDAVKSQDVQLGEISPARKQEMLEEAAGQAGLDPEDISAVEASSEYKALKIRERRQPKLAEADKQAAIVQAINETLGENPGGRYASFEDYSDQTGITDPKEAASKLGLEREAARAVRKATIINEENLNPLKLNGRGYGKALQTLQQQFPYYIARAEYIAPESGRSDSGYVKPKFIRPEEALDGYYDPTITGGGKITADRTNYQNYSVVGKPTEDKTDVDGVRFRSASYYPKDGPFARKEKDETRDEEGSDGLTPTGSGPTSSGGAASSDAQRKANTPDEYDQLVKDMALFALVKAIKSQDTFGEEASDDQGKQYFGPIDEASWLGVAKNIHQKSEDELYDMVATPEGRKTLEGEISRVKQYKMVDVDPQLWKDHESGGATKRMPLPERTVDILRGIGNKTFDLPNVKDGQKKAVYDGTIDALLRTNAELRMLGATDTEVFASSERTYEEMAPHIKAQADKLADLDMRLMAYERNASGATAPPAGYSRNRVKQEAKMLAALSQAYQTRDRLYPPEAAPKADAPGAGADYAVKLQDAAAPHQEKIHSMIGMDKVASEVDKLVAQAIIGQRREQAGLKNESRPMHLVFTGNPGTGKTTVAEIIAPLYADLGLTKKPTVKTLTKSELTGPYANQVEEHTRKVLNANKGGVIIIDEAYTLANDAEGKKAIEEMVPMLTKELKDTVVILAGYPGRMQQFMDVNEGLSRRFPKTIPFRDYTADEMRQIADSMLAAREYTATKPAVRAAIKDAVTQLAAKPNNGNAGGVSNFINHARDAQEVRLLAMTKGDPTKEQLSELTPSDIKYAMMAMGLEPSKPRHQAA